MYVVRSYLPFSVLSKPFNISSPSRNVDFASVEEWNLLMGHYSLLLGVRGEALAGLVMSMP